MFRVPLVLEVSIAVIHRLNLAATKQLQPFPGQESGYDPDFKEPIVYDQDTSCDDCGKTERVSARIELPPIRVPCQVEVLTHEELHQTNAGDAPNSVLRLVTHRMDLGPMGLIEAQTRELKLRVNDRVEGIEMQGRPGVWTQKFAGEGLFITEIEPASFGFGPEGFDLYLLHLSDREKAA